MIPIGLLDKIYDVVSWFCAGIAYRFVGEVLEVLVMVYRPDPINSPELKQLKFIGGTNTDAPGDTTPEATLLREFKVESGAEIVYYLPLHQVFKPGRGGRPDHRQFFCLVEFNGDLRTTPIWDGTEFLEAPHWRVFDETLLRDIFPSHREALMALGKLLRQKIVR